MMHFVGLDVSVKATSVCIVDAAGLLFDTPENPQLKMVYRGGCGSALDAECVSPSATMRGSRSVRPRASMKER